MQIWHPNIPLKFEDNVIFDENEVLLSFVFVELKYKWIIMNEEKYKFEPRLYFRYL